MEGRITKQMKRDYLCLCGAATCRGTMLALPKKKRAKRSAEKADTVAA